MTPRSDLEGHQCLFQGCPTFAFDEVHPGTTEVTVYDAEAHPVEPVGLEGSLPWL